MARDCNRNSFGIFVPGHLISCWQACSASMYFSLFLMRKPHSSDQKRFLISQYLEVCLCWKVVLDFRLGTRGKGHFHLLKWPFPHSRFGHFRSPKRKYTPQLVGNMASETTFDPFNVLGPKGTIFKFTYLESSHQIQQLG